MKFWRNKKIIIILVVAIFFSISGFEVARVARAAEGGESAIGGITSIAVYMAALATTFLINSIGASFFTLMAALLDVALQANALLLSSPVVLKGWGIVLDFANLGFVLAIIIIAFATIFRMQSYAMKQTLWKLIVAALLVNFSLVIAGAFINVADNVTSSFNNKIVGANISTALTGLLEVQTFTKPNWEGVEKMGIVERYGRTSLKAMDAILNFNSISWITGLKANSERFIFGDNQSGLSIYTGEKDLNPEALLKTASSLFFALIATLLSALTLLAVTVMFFIRYFFLGILLVLSPIVWLLWIFPATASYWQKWWNNFLKWVFFAPIMLFFLYLALSIVPPKTENLGNVDSQKTVQGSNQFEVDLKTKQENLQTVDLAKIGNLAIVIGLIMSGLIAANSLSIAGAKVAYGAAQGMAKGMGKGIARSPFRAGAGVLRKTRVGENLGESLKDIGEGWENKKGFKHIATRWAGRRLSGIAGGVKKASDYKGKGIFASTWGGMKSGSGLFKNKKQQLLEEVIREEKEIEKKKGKKKEEEKEPKPKEEKKT
ncbi:MAG: hypothetical protein AAB698_01335 [Patescibacteria group bacterium]